MYSESLVSFSFVAFTFSSPLYIHIYNISVYLHEYSGIYVSIRVYINKRFLSVLNNSNPTISEYHL